MIEFSVYVLTIVGIYGLMSLSLSLQYDQTGLVNLGQVGFFMVGAYASSVVTTLLGWPIIVGFGVAIVAGAAFGVLMALPIGNLRQDYWAIRSEEHTSEIQSLMRISYHVFCLPQKL